MNTRERLESALDALREAQCAVRSLPRDYIATRTSHSVNVQRLRLDAVRRMYERPDKGGSNAEIRETVLEAMLADDANYVAAINAEDAATTAYHKAIDELEIVRAHLIIERLLAQIEHLVPINEQP